MPSGLTPDQSNRQPVHVGDSPQFTKVFVGSDTSPLEVASSSAGTSTGLSQITSSLLSLSTPLSVIKSTADSG